MSRPAKATDLSLGNIQLLGTFLLAVVFFAAAVIGGFLAGYRRGFVDQAFDSPGGNLPFLKKLAGAPTPAAPAQKGGANPAAPPSRPASRSAPQAAQADTPNHPAPSGELSATIAQSLHIQVSAGPDLEGARTLAGELAAKGYPAAVYSGDADGLHRVILGPYYNRAAANDAHDQLKADGIPSLIRFPWRAAPAPSNPAGNGSPINRSRTTDQPITAPSPAPRSPTPLPRPDKPAA